MLKSRNTGDHLVSIIAFKDSFTPRRDVSFSADGQRDQLRLQTKKVKTQTQTKAQNPRMHLVGDLIDDFDLI